ncbi:MAG: hypothetical protein HS132_06760 [Planctomycetia bacterium]|nr:hypothetical protein [Planctomycetia bacterium]
MKEAGIGRDTTDIFDEEGTRCERGEGIAGIIVLADRAIKGRVRLDEIKWDLTVEERRG